MEADLETKRLLMRKLRWKDYRGLCDILQDADVMYAWEHAFTRQEVEEWLEENLLRYKRDGISYYAVIEKTTGRLVGVCGLIIEEADGAQYTGIGYIFHKDAWGKGYATESAEAWMEYAFRHLGLEEVTAQIRPDNAASRKVAERLGMAVAGEFIRHYRGREIPHLLYSRRAEPAT